jgi:ABC-type nickel/cobalt efflux system permease component RcnA
MPETVRLEVSSYLLIVALVALWIWRHPLRRGRRRNE